MKVDCNIIWEKIIKYYENPHMQALQCFETVSFSVLFQLFDDSFPANRETTANKH